MNWKPRVFELCSSPRQTLFWYGLLSPMADHYYSTWLWSPGISFYMVEISRVLGHSTWSTWWRQSDVLGYSTCCRYLRFLWEKKHFSRPNGGIFAGVWARYPPRYRGIQPYSLYPTMVDGIWRRVRTVEELWAGSWPSIVCWSRDEFLFGFGDQETHPSV